MADTTEERLKKDVILIHLHVSSRLVSSRGLLHFNVSGFVHSEALFSCCLFETLGF